MKLGLQKLGLGARGGGRTPAAVSDIIWRGRNGVESGTANVVNDIITGAGKLSDATYVGNNCLDFGSTNTVSTGLDNSNLSKTGVFTVSFWAKSDVDATQTVISSSTTGAYNFDLLSSNRTRVLLQNDSGATYTAGQIISLGVSILDWHFYEYIGNGTSIDIRVDGASVGTITYDGNFDGTSFTASTTVGKSSSGFDGKMADVKVDCCTSNSFQYRMAEGSGNPYDISGNSNHATGNTATWTTDDDAPALNIKGGFRVAVQQTAPYIPALLDGTLAADGGAITNKGGYTHNGAESLIKQTADAMKGLTLDGTDTFWSADGVTLDGKSYADLLAHLSGDVNMWNKWQSIGGVCHLQEILQYEFDKIFTAAERNKNSAYVGSGGGCGGIAPFLMVSESGDQLITEDLNTIILE